MDRKANHAANRPPTRGVNVAKRDHGAPRTAENSIGIDDIGLPSQTEAENARPPFEIQPEPGRSSEEHVTETEESSAEYHEEEPTGTTGTGTTPEPPEEEEKTGLEKAISKVVPPSHEVKDDDILDPGHMTPGAPPVDNRS